MKRHITILLLLAMLHITGWAEERGVPFFRNFSATDYKARNRNFDIACDNYGTVFVANFEGLIYYDGATWRKILTPGISRVTCIAKGPDGKIWIGGYNVFGYLVADANGRLQMKLLMSDANNKGNIEFEFIKVAGKEIYSITTRGRIYHVKNGNSLEMIRRDGKRIFNQATDSVRSLRLPDMARVSYSDLTGLKFTMPDDSYTTLSEADGLTSNNISYVTFDNKHTLWGATVNGIFCTEVSTPYSHLSDSEGLKGEVNGINELGNTIYIGTTKGLFMLKNAHVTKIEDINQTCWDLIDDGNNSLVAPTSQGLYIITTKGVHKLTSNNTLSTYVDKVTGDYITGDLDGVYRISRTGKRVKIASIEKVTYITSSGDNLILRNIYGTSWQIPASQKTLTVARCISRKIDASAPKLYYKGPLNRIWKTDATGMNLQVSNTGTNDYNLSKWITPLKNKSLNTIHVCHDGNIIAGGDFGVIIIAAREMMAQSTGQPDRPCIRQVTVMEDSVVWGGYSRGTLKPVYDINKIYLPASCHDVMVTFSTPVTSLVSPTLYRYRVNEGPWTNWSKDTFVDFNNLSSGKTTLEIQARDIFGRDSEISSVTWIIAAPWYLSWWAYTIYLIILIYIITIFFRWRERKLEQDKQKLEGIVAKRTSELSAAYDKQQKISSELSDTLDDLKRTQDDLVRMERTATAGKLTQGLIDRILNPINYINNFSKLTSGLANDLKEDIEDEKDNMSEDNYEDCEDILDMMNQNLSKIEEHGVNTTRTLRAMEAMLNNHVGALVNQDICPLCHQVAKIVQEHFKDEIARCSIAIKTDLPGQPVMADIDAESINRILLSLMSNSIYAITKKYSKTPYNNAEIVLSVKESDGHVVIRIHDNGIGIEDAIKDKVFDPFFTTKPTGEASGVGLYLVREIINDHHGTIALNSEKGEYCEFTITL